MPHPHADRQPQPMELRHRVVGPWSVNAYALICKQTATGVLIDPGAQPDELTAMLTGCEPMAILVTHSHPDHIGALDDMRRRLKVPVMAHSATSVAADRLLEDGDHVVVGRHRLEIIHTPGHTPDQICFRPQEDHRTIVGDTIFDGGPGKTWSTADFRQTLKTLQHIILPWPDDTVCHPGHGNSFRLGDIRSRVDHFLARDHGDFYGDATWD